MGIALIVFLFVVALVMGTYAAIAYLPGFLATREMDKRLKDVSSFRVEETEGGESIVRAQQQGPLPAIDKMLKSAAIGKRIDRLIDHSGVQTTPSALIVGSLCAGLAGFLLAMLFSPQPAFRPLAALAGMAAPIMWLKHKAHVRLKRFEEQFPEALDLLSRALRAGHAFQTAMGMVADELAEPVGPEFKKAFDQQNYGLPLKDALNELADRVDLLDVRFFVTAVLIQRDTGGNLSEILDNLAHVVRERFKILRQVRVHTAHGRFTGYVLLGLPAFLAIALMYLNPEHMGVLFREPIGQMMVIATVIMQTIGFFWIRQVIKIEV